MKKTNINLPKFVRRFLALFIHITLMGLLIGGLIAIDHPEDFWKALISVYAIGFGLFILGVIVYYLIKITEKLWD